MTGLASAPGMIVAAPRSGSGKTTVMLGLLRALTRRGVRAKGMKCGPDYIDPAFHVAATGCSSVNLDIWAMTPQTIGGLAATATQNADIVICEGSMGLFDGVPAPEGRSGASADIAAVLGWPVLLVIDVSGQSQTAAAVVKGCATFDPRIRIAGVIMNKVGSPRHKRLAGEAIEALGIPVLGSLPRRQDVHLPERHLGLVQARETSGLDDILDHMADFIEENTDVAAVVAAASPLLAPSVESIRAFPPPAQRIALAQDAAFSFFYTHLIEQWQAAGCEFFPFSPLADEAPSRDCDLCWLPGGYPELHAGHLASAQNFMEGLRRFAQSKPVHGECGGYMVLGQTLTDAAGKSHVMAGLLGVSTSFAARRMTLGYREAELCCDTPLGKKGTRLRGHEFHYATVTETGADDAFAMMRDPYDSPPVRAGSCRGLVSGSFFHLIGRA